MTDIIYQYKNNVATWEELRYSLRSVEKNAKFKHRIVFVGDMPEWVQNAHHIPVKSVPQDNFTVCFDAARKMNAAILNKDTSAKFIYMYDDLYFINPVRLKDFATNYYLPMLSVDKDREAKLRANRKKHVMLKVRTLDALRAKGICTAKAESIEAYNEQDQDYFYDFETHMPKLYEKEKMVNTFKAFAPGKNRLLFSTLYFNSFNKSIEPLNRDVKAEFFGPSELAFLGSSSGTEESCKEAMQKPLFMNHNDMALTTALKNVLVEMFPNKSKYEK